MKWDGTSTYLGSRQGRYHLLAGTTVKTQVFTINVGYRVGVLEFLRVVWTWITATSCWLMVLERNRFRLLCMERLLNQNMRTVFGLDLELRYRGEWYVILSNSLARLTPAHYLASCVPKKRGSITSVHAYGMHHHTCVRDITTSLVSKFSDFVDG